MTSLNRRDLTDKLYFKLRAAGYSTIGRRYGTYLPDPPNIGDFEIEVLAKQKKEFAIGIVLDDLSGVDVNFIKQKIRFLAERKSTYSGNPVRLYIALTRKNYFFVKHLIDSDLKDISENIELYLVDVESELVITDTAAGGKAMFPRFIN